jgi:hypothetical protein
MTNEELRAQFAHVEKQAAFRFVLLILYLFAGWVGLALLIIKILYKIE